MLTLTSKCILYYDKEQQQLEADIERLTSDRADLRSKLHCYEEDLKAANERKNWVFQIANTHVTNNSVLTMREKAISGMMAAAAHREKDERIMQVP